MVDDNDRPQLIDFGLCSFFERHEGVETLSFDHCGSIEYMAPEFLQRAPIQGTAADAWAFGITIFALLWGSFPFSPEEAVEVFRQHKTVPLPYDTKDLMVSGPMRQRLQRLLTIDPSQRGSVEVMM